MADPHCQLRGFPTTIGLHDGRISYIRVRSGERPTIVVPVRGQRHSSRLRFCVCIHPFVTSPEVCTVKPAQGDAVGGEPLKPAPSGHAAIGCLPLAFARVRCSRPVNVEDLP